ncbi:TetR family transcriptional regulator, partial [Faecalitalea cylindroides]
MDTKYLLAEALKICMKKAPLEKITVKDITDTCGISRQTYYRHFQDKQDLVNWY